LTLAHPLKGWAKALRRGWHLGEEQLKEELLERMRFVAEQHHGGEAKQEAEE